mmetsp:Transcript_18676/g.47466  ORF Transcript_18676/g.47466 Transcript_18676/m.47466 type:complete len:296 (+) Transcript_18676:749-1636(+)
MNQLEAMQVGHALCHIIGKAELGTPVEDARLIVQHVVQTAQIHQLEHQTERIAHHTQQADDVRMVHGAHELGLAAELLKDAHNLLHLLLGDGLGQLQLLHGHRLALELAQQHHRVAAHAQLLAHLDLVELHRAVLEGVHRDVGHQLRHRHRCGASTEDGRLVGGGRTLQIAEREEERLGLLTLGQAVGARHKALVGFAQPVLTERVQRLDHGGDVLAGHSAAYGQLQTVRVRVELQQHARVLHAHQHTVLPKVLGQPAGGREQAHQQTWEEAIGQKVEGEVAPQLRDAGGQLARP